MSERIYLAPTRVTGREQFGRVMAACRTSAGMTREGVAERVHVTKSTMSTRETGRRNTSVADAVETLALYGYALMVVPLEAVERAERDTEAR